MLTVMCSAQRLRYICIYMHICECLYLNIFKGLYRYRHIILRDRIIKRTSRILS